MNFGRLVVLVIFGDTEKGINIGTTFYFAIAAGLIYATVRTLIKFIDSPYYVESLTKKFKK